MRQNMLYYIWGNARVICPECYRKLDDYELEEDGLLWLCHHCESETREPEFSSYRMIDVIYPQLRYSASAFIRKLKEARS